MVFGVASECKPRGESAESSGDVVFCAFFSGVREYLGGFTEFNEFAVQEESGVVGDASGLVHIVRDYNKRVFTLQFFNESLYSRC